MGIFHYLRKNENVEDIFTGSERSRIRAKHTEHTTF